MTDIAIRRAILFGALSLCVAVVFSWSSIGTITRARGGGDPWVDAGAPASIGQLPVVVELFTSEGCSSCPPADEVLSRLVREPLGGAVVLGLGEHVDYWDRLGGGYPFSSRCSPAVRRTIRAMSSGQAVSTRPESSWTAASKPLGATS